MLDGHDRCPPCLGREHLKEALSNPCPECSIMPVELRQQRLASVCSFASEVLPASVRSSGSKRKHVHGDDGAQPKSKRKTSSALAKRMDELSDTVQHLQTLLANATAPATAEARAETTAGDVSLLAFDQHPFTSDTEVSDVVSVAATDSLFSEASGQPLDDRTLAPARSSPLPSVCGSEPRTGSEASSTALSLHDTLKRALAKLELDLPSASTGPANLLCRSVPGTKEVRLPHCKDFTDVVSAAFQSALSFRPDRVSRMLADMSTPDAVGLGAMPALEPCVASLIVSPDEALRQDVRCPNKECRRTDDALVKVYNTVARLGRVGNSMGHLLLALHSSSDFVGHEDSTAGLLDASLQALGAVASDCGRALGLLVHARRQVWLAQSPLPEVCRNNLRQLPLIPGHLFGPAAQEALERRVRVTESRSHHVERRTTFREPPATLRPPRQTPTPQRTPPGTFNRFSRGRQARSAPPLHRNTVGARPRSLQAGQLPYQRPPKGTGPADRRR